MKKSLFLAVLLCSIFAISQNNNNYNQISIEASYGLNHPLSPSSSSGLKASEFSEFKHFDIGGRYMVSRIYGVKLSYAYDRFQWDATSLAINYHRVGVEAVVNLAEVFNFSFNRQRSFQIQTHAGIGVTFAKPKRDLKSEKIGNLMIGITPLIRITDRIAITTDLSYIVNLKQHYDYGGTLVDSDGDSKTGSFLNFTVGLNYALGNNRDHADWH